MIGSIIKKNRLDQNMSQESLCKGICAVSYLSKIENDQAHPSHEILAMLLDRLGIPFPETLGEIESYRNQIYGVIHELFYGDEEKAHLAFEGLKDKCTLFVASPAVVDWHILDGYFAYNEGQWNDLSEKIDALDAYSKHFTIKQQYHFYSLKGQLAVHDVDYDAALDAFVKAQNAHRDGMIISLLSMTYYYKGDYVSAITYGNDAYFELMDAGYLTPAINISGIVASAYSNLNQIDQALYIYKRQLNLTLYTHQKHIQYSVNYNIGATYLMRGDFRQSVDYLHKALDYLDANDVWTYFYLYQKLVLCHIGLKQWSVARQWLEKLESYVNLSQSKPEASLLLSIKWLGFFKDHEDPKQVPGYLEALKATFDQSKRDSHFGFHLFYGQYLCEAYKANRKYKEALSLVEVLKLS